VATKRPRKVAPAAFSGRGVDTDIIVASAKAYLQALNKMLAVQEADSSSVNIAADEPATA
jgi:2-isopropylmalate synthase